MRITSKKSKVILMLHLVGLMILFITYNESVQAKEWILGSSTSNNQFQDVLDQAYPQDTIRINGATLTSSFQIKKSLRLIGENGAKFDAKGKPISLLILFSDSVIIEGFNFTGVAPSFTKEVSAILIKPSSASIIKNNKIDSCFFGIYIEYGKNHIIKQNHIIGYAENEAEAGNAIHVWKAKNLFISENYVAFHRDGIYFEFVDDSIISLNHSENNLRYGLHFMFSNKDRYSGNRFNDNGTGVAVMFSRNITMIGNHFEDNWGGSTYGLLLKEISDGFISANMFHHNTIGVLAEGANRITLISNVFLSNGTAIDMKGNCMDNRILQNDFMGNIFEVVTNSTKNNNEYAFNYWSQHKSYDLNRDSFSDTAYRPVNLFSKIVQEIPSASLLIHSFISDLLVLAERMFPDLIPPLLIDLNPKFRPYGYLFN